MKFKDFLFESLSYTQEMEKYFKKRTNKHIQLVQKYGNLLAEKFNIKGLKERIKYHDQSKFQNIEKIPYIFITWDYHCKDLGKNFKLSQNIKNKMNSATLHHIKNNSHHPEYFDKNSEINKENRDKKPNKIVNATKMKDLDIAEMVADWLAMGEERGNTAKSWADKNINVRWKFTDNQKNLIYKYIKGIENEMD